MITETEDTAVTEKTESSAGEQENTAGKGLYSMPEGAVEESEVVGSDFWEGITLPKVEKPKKEKRGKSVLITVISSLLCLCMGAAITVVAVRGKGTLSNLITGNKHMTFSLPLEHKPDIDPKYKEEDGRFTSEGIAAYCVPSVVSIDIYRESVTGGPKGVGSGIIISSDGYIVSNAHVIDPDALALKAILSDGREYSVEIIGRDEVSDIAVVKIPVTGLQPAVFGDSSELKLGEEVMAIGNPAGYRNSVSKGVISGFNRSVMVERINQRIEVMQVDCPINPGNSGGALFNMWGQVVGITSSKLSTYGYDSVGFAISSNNAKKIIEDLMEHGRVLGRARIGITYYQIPTAAADVSDIKPGLLVVTIDESCDVANTELRVGDIITSIDGFDIFKTDNASALLAGRSPGDVLNCHVYRPADDPSKEGTEFDITFELMEDTGTLVTTDVEVVGIF